MEVKDKLMYHFHKSGIHDDMWKKGSSIDVDNNFNSDLVSGTISEFNTNGLKNFKDVSLSDIIDNYLEHEENRDLLSKITRNIKSRDVLMSLLVMSSKVMWSANIFKREMALEEIRRDYFSHLPSRKHCIWVTDKQGIDFWRKKLTPSKDSSFNLILYSVSLSGNLFRSNEMFLPGDSMCYEECLKSAFDYWNPDFSFSSETSDEYLFQGKVKVIDRIL